MYLLEEEIDYSYGADKDSDEYMMNYHKNSHTTHREISKEEEMFLEKFIYDSERKENEYFCKVSKLIEHQKCLNECEKRFVFSLNRRFKTSLVCTPIEEEKINLLYSRVF